MIGDPWARLWLLYEEHLRVRQNSHRTIDGLRWYLERFFSFLDAIGLRGIHEVDRSVLERFREERFNYVNERGRQDKPITQAKYIWAVRSFYAWLHKAGHIVGNPAADFDYPRLPRRLAGPVLSHEEMKNLLAACDVTTANGFRDRTMLEFLYSTGLRLSEFRRLQTGDLDLEKGTVFVREGKGKKDRVVPVGRIACVFLENYLQGVRPLFVGPGTGDHVFLSNRGRSLSPSGAWGILKKCAERAGLEKVVSMHTLRRTFATALIAGGAKAAHVKDMLGHEGFQSLSSYLNLTIRDLLEAHKKYHPRERDGGARKEEEGPPPS